MTTQDDPDQDDDSDQERRVRSDAIRGAIAPPDDADDAAAPSAPDDDARDEAADSAASAPTAPTGAQPESVMTSLGDEPAAGDLKTSRKHVNMYLREPLADAIDDRFEELAALCELQRGTAIEKNRDYYPAVFEAAFRRDAHVADVLGVDIDDATRD